MVMSDKTRGLIRLGFSLVAISLVFLSGTAFATADPNPLNSKYPTEVSVSRMSAPADGVSKIDFEVFIFGYKCLGETTPSETALCTDGSTSNTKMPLDNRLIGIYDYGYESSVIYTGTTLEIGQRFLMSDSNGKATFQLAATSPGVKKLQFSDHKVGVVPSWASTQEVTFTQVPVSADTSTSKAPSAPILTKVEVSGKTINSSEIILMDTTQTLDLTGTTVANGQISLDISAKTSQKKTVKADKDGKWSYGFVKPAAGSYVLNASVTDPASGKSSSAVSLISFNVEAAETAKKETKDSSEQTTGSKAGNSKKWLWVAIAGLGLVTIAVTIWQLFRHRKKKQQPVIKDTAPSTEDTTPTPPAES
jgi:hypothetical protein